MTAIRLFVSHSSEDAQLASRLVELLRASLNLPRSVIRCTSVDGYRLPGGADTDEQLRREVHDAEAFIGIVSTASTRSMYVLFELGARWGIPKHLVPLLAPGTPASVLRGPLSGLNALSADNEAQVSQLISEVGSVLDVPPAEPEAYQALVDELVHTPPTAMPPGDAFGLPPVGKRRFRPADLGDIDQIHRLASEIYGPRYRFPDATLRAWWKLNPKCFYVMLCDSIVVGYIDAFPITEGHYQHLLAGKEESLITPQRVDDVGPESSFYIASIVIAPNYRGNERFFRKASRFYEKAYPRKPWTRVCAMAYTPDGEKWIKRKGMFQVGNTAVWCIDEHSWSNLGDENRAFWRPFFGDRVGHIK